MLDLMREAIERYHMLEPGDRVLVAVSGGPDSTALLHGLWTLREHYGLSLHVAHLNHRFRGDEAAADAEYVRRLASDLGLPCTVEEADVAALARARKWPAQVAGREARYRLFYRLSADVGARRIALGHTADDQAETVLMRLLRGTGLDGLAGIPPVRDGRIIRPLILCTRRMIEEYCRANGLTPRTDRTNLKGIYLRNRIRLSLLPALEREYNPRVRTALAQLAEQAREDAGALNDRAGEVFGRASRPAGGGVELDWNIIRSEPKAIQRRVVRRAYSGVTTGLPEMAAGLEFRHVEEILALVSAGAVSGRLDLPGRVGVERQYDRLFFFRRSGETEAGRGAVGFSDLSTRGWPLAVPGVTVIPELGLSFQVEVLESVPDVRAISGEDQAQDAKSRRREVFDADALGGGPLYVRTRRPGDRFVPLGMRGFKKLKDFLIGRRIPLRKRGKLPLIFSGEDLVWVVGLRIDDRFKIKPQTKRVLAIAVKTGP